MANRSKRLFHYSRTGLNASRSRLGTVSLILLLIVIGAFMGLPFLYAILQSLKPMSEIFMYPPRFFVKNPTIESYYLLTQYAETSWVPFTRYLSNSIFYTVAATAAQVLLSSMAAFVLAKGKIKGRNVMFGVVVTALLFSYEITAIPSYVIMAKLGLINTAAAIVLPAIATPLSLFLMKQFMESSIPDPMIEAAKIDGASPFGIFFKIAMPMVKPAWLTLIILAFQQIWNREGLEYIYSESLKALPTMLRQIAAAGIARAGVASAAAVIMMIPPILVFVMAQSNVVETMSHSGIK